MGRPRKNAAAQQPELVVIDEAQVVESASAVEPMVVEKPHAGLYRVTRGVFFNQHGAAQWLAVGTIIDESVVGAAHIATLRVHKVPLEEV